MALILCSLFAIRFFSISRTCNEKDELLCEIHNLSDYGNAYNVILHYRKDGRSYSKSQAIVKNSEAEGLRNYSVVRAFCSGRNKRKVFVKNLYMDSDEKLDLFNEGSIDYGTMDPVRIARLKNGNFCLSGFRMLPLELDSAFNPHF